MAGRCLAGGFSRRRRPALVPKFQIPRRNTKPFNYFGMNSFDADVVDLTYLQGITRGNQAMMDSFIQMFHTEHQKVLLDLTEAYRQQDQPGVAQAAHKLKASVKALGAHALYRALVHLEDLATLPAAGPSHLEQGFAQVQQENGRFQEALNRQLN